MNEGARRKGVETNMVKFIDSPWKFGAQQDVICPSAEGKMRFNGETDWARQASHTSSDMRR